MKIFLQTHGELGGLNKPEHIFRILFMLTAVYAAGVFWLAPRPPMADLPQLAVQAATLKDLMDGHSPWANVYTINLFTPYLTSYLAWLGLSHLFSVTVSAKILLSLGYLFFIYACIRLRKTLDGDERLDWLFIPGFFGICFKWGFFTFMLATPFCLLFIAYAKQFADTPSLRKGVHLLLTGILVFFSHGLAFWFALAVGLGFLLKRFELSKAFLWLCLPYILLAVFFSLYIVSKSLEASESIAQNGLYWGWYRGRLEQFLIYILGKEEDAIFLPITLLLFAFPFLLGSRLKLQWHDRQIPFIVLLLVWAVWPSWGFLSGMDFAFIYQRFALFTLPLYAMLFQPATPAFGQIRTLAALTAAMLACWLFLGVQSVRMYRFADESADFDKLTAVAEPRHSALYLIFDAASPAAGNSVAYRHFPAWYQVQSQGNVEFNFAWYRNQVVIFRDNQNRAIPRYGSQPAAFRWREDAGDSFYYFFIRGELPANFFAAASCPIRKIAESGAWALYRGCGQN
ncbi:MAG: hypothetical protein PHW13_06300 [Methylococcales bacterium]|nr:hypothetical protein [Methylococcales bacterium]